jgi:hypothetical protein
VSNSVDFYDYPPTLASYRAEQVWADEQALFSVHGLRFGSIPLTTGREFVDQAIITEARG